MEILMRYITKETIDDYAKIRSDIFGDIILQAMGYKADCHMFCKCKSDDNVYNIAWCLENGKEYIQTFFIEEIMKAFENKELILNFSIKNCK